MDFSPILTFHKQSNLANKTRKMAETADLFEYNPSLAAAVIFAVLFGFATFTHAYQLVRTRTWFMLAFLIGGVCEYRLSNIQSQLPASY